MGIEENLDCGTRRYLFRINTGDEDKSYMITTLVRRVEFFKDHCIVEYIKDGEDTVWNHFSNLTDNLHGGKGGWALDYLDREGRIISTWTITYDFHDRASELPPTVDHGETGMTFYRLTMGFKYLNCVQKESK